MADTPSAAPGQPPDPSNTAQSGMPPVVVKKYANRRLYNTETSSYITLDNLAGMIRAGRDFVVYDAKSSEDITRGVLTQIIVEEESKGSSMLPTAFLRQLIGFYGGSLQGVVPKYLEQAMATFSQGQQQMRTVMEKSFPFLPPPMEEMGRQNLAFIERALTMFNPFARTADAPKAERQDGNATTAPQPAPTELQAMQHEIESLRAQLAIARAEAVIHAPHAIAPHAIAHAPAQAAPVNVLADPPHAPMADAVGEPPAAPKPAAPLVMSRKGRTPKR